MGYKILIEYSTGNSFGNHDEKEYLDITFKNIEIAKDNINRISEHYKQYLDTNDYTNRGKKEDIFKENENKVWFIKKMKPAVKSGNSYMAIDDKYIDRYKSEGVDIIYVYDDYQAEHCIKLKADNGNDYIISAFWVGYFERLNAVEIVTDNSDMRIEF